MAISFYHGMPISGSGLQVIHMTRAEYERDKDALDKTDFLIDLTDEDSPVISGEDIKGANNWTLASEILESRILGWTVPSNFKTHNYSNSTYFFQTVGRKKLSEFNWTKNSNILFTSTAALENAKAGGAFAAYNSVCQISRTSEQYITAAGANVIGKTEDTVKTFLDDADTYVYYELETPIQHKLWGGEITTQINNDLSELSSTKQDALDSGVLNVINRMRRWTPASWKSEGGTFTLSSFGNILRLDGTFTPNMTNTSAYHTDSYFIFISYEKKLYIGICLDNEKNVTWVEK